MTPAGLAALGFTRDAPLGGATEGAWLGTTHDGTSVILKWSPDPGMAARYLIVKGALDTLTSRGVPVTRYTHILPLEGGTLTAQRPLPGRSEDQPPAAVIDAVANAVAAQTGLPGPPPRTHAKWGGFVRQTLTTGQVEWCAHAPLAQHSAESAALLTQIRAIGETTKANTFPDTGLVHLDLHTDNILIEDGQLSGIIDWDGACYGDPRYDLMQFAFDLDGHDWPHWGYVDALEMPPPVLRAYAALLVLKSLSAAICNVPEDVPRQLARAARVFARFGM